MQINHKQTVNVYTNQFSEDEKGLAWKFAVKQYGLYAGGQHIFQRMGGIAPVWNVPERHEFLKTHAAAQLGRIERGQRSAMLDTFEKIANGLGISLSQLLDIECDAEVKCYDEVTNKILSISLGLKPTDRVRALMLLKALIWEPEESG